MDSRQETILKLLVDEYIRTAEPVGSRFLAEKYTLDISPATIRNVMAILEEEGYLAQPHTSAGRIPTEKAFVYYLKHFVEPERGRKSVGELRHAVQESEDEAAIKAIAKTLVNLSGEMAIVGFDGGVSYYTGVSNLFQKPEFSDLQAIQSLSAMMDRFDDVVEEMFDAVSEEPSVMIGQQNPLGNGMSAVMVKYALPGGRIGILGLVGPMRMNYARNLGLVQEAKEILDEEEV